MVVSFQNLCLLSVIPVFPAVQATALEDAGHHREVSLLSHSGMMVGVGEAREHKLGTWDRLISTSFLYLSCLLLVPGLCRDKGSPTHRVGEGGMIWGAAYLVGGWYEQWWLGLGEWKCQQEEKYCLHWKLPFSSKRHKILDWKIRSRSQKNIQIKIN